MVGGVSQEDSQSVEFISLCVISDVVKIRKGVDVSFFVPEERGALLQQKGWVKAISI